MKSKIIFLCKKKQIFFVRKWSLIYEVAYESLFVEVDGDFLKNMVFEYFVEPMLHKNIFFVIKWKKKQSTLKHFTYRYPVSQDLSY